MGDDRLTGGARVDKCPGCVNLSVHTNLNDSTYMHSVQGGGDYLPINM